MVDPRSRRSAEDPDDLPEPPKLRALRHLVTALTIVLMLGMVTIAGALVVRITRTPDTPAPPVATITAERVVVPDGERITATGAAGTALMLVTEDQAGVERIRLYDGATGALQQVVMVARGTP